MYVPLNMPVPGKSVSLICGANAGSMLPVAILGLSVISFPLEAVYTTNIREFAITEPVPTAIHEALEGPERWK